MANFTKNAIKETFIKLIEERPLSEITVKEIVKVCGINRNSFYYHYADLPTLIEELIKEDAEKIINKYPSVTSMVECFDAVSEFAACRKKAIMHIYRSVNREVFEKYLMDVSDYFISNYVETAVRCIPITERDKKTVKTFYKGVCFGLVMEWLNSGMDESFAKEIRRIFLLKKDLSLEVAQFLKTQI